MSAFLNTYLFIVLGILAIFCFILLIKIIIANTPADRLLVANMMGGIVIVMIGILAIILDESFLLDVAVIYALISFLAVVILSQIYTQVFKTKYHHKRKNKEMKGE